MEKSNQKAIGFPHRTKQMSLHATQITTGAINEKNHPPLQSKRESANWEDPIGKNDKKCGLSLKLAQRSYSLGL